MSGLRSAWTPEQVQENLGEAHEGLPEARITDRFPVAGTASGMAFRAGEVTYEEEASSESDIRFELPPDPPRRSPGQDGA
jgi:hypothetical protein